MSTTESTAQIIAANMADAPLHTPQKIHLKDYQPPSFNVKTVDLDAGIATVELMEGLVDDAN